uniref:Uncharacterized protein n=1 Tax=Arundo donax TaxID=35708 RepID=A0A0A9H3L9_ARUDO
MTFAQSDSRMVGSLIQSTTRFRPSRHALASASSTELQSQRTLHEVSKTLPYELRTTTPMLASLVCA